MLFYEIYFFKEGSFKSGVSLAFFHADFKSGIIYLKKLTNFMFLPFLLWKKLILIQLTIKHDQKTCILA